MSNTECRADYFQSQRIRKQSSNLPLKDLGIFIILMTAVADRRILSDHMRQA